MPSVQSLNRAPAYAPLRLFPLFPNKELELSRVLVSSVFATHIEPTLSNTLKRLVSLAINVTESEISGMRSIRQGPAISTPVTQRSHSIPKNRENQKHAISNPLD